MHFKRWFVENFNTTAQFLLNPEYSNKTWPELERDFKADGGEIINYGSHSAVFAHPAWNYVLKKYDDPVYTAFVRFAYQHPNLAFPKFYGLPKKIIPHYRRNKSNAVCYIVRMERLYPINRSTFELIDRYYQPYLAYVMSVSAGQGDIEDDVWSHQGRTWTYDPGPRKGIQPVRSRVPRFKAMIDFLQQHPQIKKVFEGLLFLQQNGPQGALDMHQGNFMQRLNGDIVIADPLWEGSNPYRDAALAMSREIDNFPDDDEEPDVMGGKLPKFKKPRPQPQKSLPSTDVPF